jgi:hypothetical protein
MSAPGSRITGRALRAGRFAGIHRTYGRRKFMRSIIDLSSPGSRLPCLGRRKTAFRTIPKPHQHP